jgi:curved DNA-binding protein CbpA
MKREIQRITLAFLFCWLSCCNYFGCEAQPAEERSSSSCGPQVSNDNFHWENYNYYEILGLEEVVAAIDEKKKKKTTSTSSSKKKQQQQQKQRLDHDLKDIKKAYRKQAQQWHPDKVSVKQTNITLSESNARFGRIAEAYSVLNDPETRREYNDFLVNCENQQQQQQQQPPGASNNRWWEQFSTDPLSVFEDFFFGTSDYDDNNEQSSDASWEQEFFRGGASSSSGDSYSSFSSSSSSSSGSSNNYKTNTGYRAQKSRQPLGVYESREMVYDQYSGEELLRVLQRNEFLEPDGRLYYRIVAQEFTHVYNVYSGATSLQPVTQPYLLEEGHFLQEEEEPSQQQQQQHQEQHQKKNGYARGRTTTEPSSQSTLYEGDILTPESNKLLKSPNRRYYAGLSTDCELLVMSETHDDLVWTSDTFVPRGSCFAMLEGPHLMVGLGPPSRPRTILWYSNVHANTYGDDDDYYYDYDYQDEIHTPIPPTFVAQLDNDGSLVVYRMVTLPSPFPIPTTRAAKAYLVTRQYIVGTLLGQSFPSPTMITYKTCIHATGPMGCNRLGRRVLQLASDTTYLVKHLLAKLDHLFDTWMELFLEEEDLVGVLVEALHRGIEYCKQHGTVLARTSMRVARDMVRQATKGGSK